MSEPTGDSSPKLYDLNTHPFKLKVRGPATVEEYNEKAGPQADGSNACLVDAIENELYRGTIPAFWNAFIPKCEELTSIKQAAHAGRTEKAKARAKTPEAAAKVKDQLETPKEYISRVFAQVDDAVKAKLHELAASVAATIEIDPSPSSRAARGPGKTFLDKADDVLSRDEDAIEAAVAKIATPGVEVARDENGKPLRESLAYAIKAFMEASV